MSATVSDPDLACLARADLVLLTAAMLSRPRQLQGPDSRIPPAQLLELVETANEGADPELLATLGSALAELRAMDREVVVAEHTRLFEGPVTCPINETAFVRRDKGVIIADICGFYNAFGFEPDEASGEKADHLVSELEFTGVLLVMLGEAYRAGDEEKIAIVHDAIRGFLGDHLGEWLALFCRRLTGSTGLPAYRRGAELLRSLWNLLARAYELPVFDALDDELAEEPDVDAGTPYECDMAEADGKQLIQLTGPAGSGLPQADGAGR